MGEKRKEEKMGMLTSHNRATIKEKKGRLLRIKV